MNEPTPCDAVADVLRLHQEVHDLRGELHGVRLKLDVEQAQLRALADALRELIADHRRLLDRTGTVYAGAGLEKALISLATLDYDREVSP